MTDELSQVWQPVWWDGPATVALLRRQAQAHLPPGTLYEVRSSIPGDFGRGRAVGYLRLALEESSLVPYVPGQPHPDLARGHVLHCRERVPEPAGSRDG